MDGIAKKKSEDSYINKKGRADSAYLVQTTFLRPWNI